MSSGHHPPPVAFTLAVGVAGHRSAAAGEDALAAVVPLAERVLDQLRAGALALHARVGECFSADPPLLRLVSPLAEGADQILAEAGLARGFALEAILPLPRDDYAEDFAPAARARLDALIDRSTRVLELPRQSGARETGYTLAGRATVAHSDLLVVIWDGFRSRGPGGTADVVERALRRGKPVIQLPTDPAQPPRVLWTEYDLLVSPDDQSAIPSRPVDAATIDALLETLLAPPADPQERRWLAQFLGEREARVQPRLEYPLLLAMTGVRAMRGRAWAVEPYAPAIHRSWRPFRAATEGAYGVSIELGGLQVAYAWSSRLASHFAQTYRSGHVLNFMLGALAVILALAGTIVPRVKLEFVFAELAAIVGFVVNTRVGLSRGWHRRWMDYRQLAERLRPMRSLQLLGAAEPNPEAIDRRGQRWVDWYAAAVWRGMGCPAGVAHDDPAPLTAFLVEQELRPQIDYHRAQARHLHHLDHRLHTIALSLFGVSIVACLIFMGGYVTEHAAIARYAAISVFLSAGLPALGAAIFGIRTQGDFAAGADRSAATADALDAIVAAIERQPDSLARRIDLFEAAARAMLADLGEWRRAFQHRRIELPA